MINIIYFSTKTCQPCATFKPIAQQAASETGATISYIDAQDNLTMSSSYGVTSVPTLIFLKNGQQVGKTIGALPKAMLINKIKQYS